MKIKNVAIVICILGSHVQLHSQGTIVPNGVTIAPGNVINVIQNPTAGDYTGFILNPQGGSSFLFSPFLDEGVRTFFVASNDPLSLQPILANNYPELTPTTYSFANGSPFYLGFYTGSSFPVNGVYSNPLFGWARLVNINGTIQLLDSALEYGGGGIYVGTQSIIPVPEPSTLTFAAIGAFALAWHVRVRRREQGKNCPIGQ